MTDTAAGSTRDGGSSAPRGGENTGSATSRGGVHGWASQARGWVATVGIVNVVIAVLAGLAGAWLVTTVGNGGLGSAVMIQAVTLPVLLARVAPARAAVALTAGTIVNEVVIGPMVRCGVILPILFVIAFHLGAATAGMRRTTRLLGIAALTATGVLELLWDPILDGAAAILIGGLGLGFYWAGLLIRSRTVLAQSLQQRTSELHQQRDRTAALAVAADREKVGTELEHVIRSQIQTIALTAEQARATNDPDQAQAALIELENAGRDTLARMRDIVGTLRDAPTSPAPGLDQLPDLLHRATGPDARLTIQGPRRPLTANVELSAYRIVEQLVTTLRDHPGARVEVVLRFTDDALEIRVSGTARARTSPATAAELDSAVDAVQARADLHGGSVRTSNPLGRREIDIRLPLLTGPPR